MATTPSKSTTGVWLDVWERTRAGWAARNLLTLVYYGLRDGEIRSLVPPEAT